MVGELKDREAVVKAWHVENMGIMIGEKEWINFDAKNSGQSPESIKLALSKLKRGCTIKATMFSANKFIGFQVIKEAPEGSSNSSFSDKIEHVKDLLVRFREKFPKFKKMTKLLEHDRESKIAVVKVTLLLEEGGQQIDALGDACPESIRGEHIKQHYIRMAETRAFGRAMRWAMGEAVLEEEKGDDIPAVTHEKINQPAP